MGSFSTSKAITVGAMTAALTILPLYAGNLVSVVNVACYFLSSVWIYALVCEGAFSMAWITYAVTGILSFFLLPNKLVALGYLVIWGHYGISRQMIERRLQNRVICMLCKVLYLDVFTAIGGFLAFSFFSGAELEVFERFPLWVVIIALQIVFILYDLLYQVCIRIYHARLRPIVTGKNKRF